MVQPHARTIARQVLLAVTLAGTLAVSAQGQTNIGDPLPGMKPVETNFFNNGKAQFFRVWGMQEGVGPVLTDGACTRCHNAPVMGGSSNRLLTFFGNVTGGVFDPLDGTGTHPNEGGLLLESRSNQAFLPNCPQGGEVLPADANAVENRMGPPVFGFGLIDAIADADIQAEAIDKGLGIHGKANVGDTFPDNPAPPHTVGRFGRKAQIANLVEMVAFAFMHDLGITNTLNPIEDLPQGQPIDSQCTLNSSVPNNNNNGSGGKGMFPISHFPRYLAPPTPLDCSGASCSHGKELFGTLGCDKCHKQSYTTPANVQVRTDLTGTSLTSPALSSQPVNLYSDLLLHDLGNADKGKIPEGYPNTSLAKVTEWRTTPLWGLQFRIANPHFMHSGSALSLDAAIKGHSDGVTGEAVTVINSYKALSPSDMADLWTFLGTL